MPVPGRAQAWRPPAPLEGAIWVETIPFNETRDYVKKVLANAMIYAQSLDSAYDAAHRAARHRVAAQRPMASTAAAVTRRQLDLAPG